MLAHRADDRPASGSGRYDILARHRYGNRHRDAKVDPDRLLSALLPLLLVDRKAREPSSGEVASNAYYRLRITLLVRLGRLDVWETVPGESELDRRSNERDLHDAIPSM